MLKPQSETIQCHHIWAYYNYLWSLEPSLYTNLLRIGYLQWSEGRADESYNNLYEGGQFHGLSRQPTE